MRRVHIGANSQEVPHIGLPWIGENWEKKYGGKRAGIIRITCEALKIIPWSSIRWPHGLAVVGYSHVLSRAMHEFLIAAHNFDAVGEGMEFGTVGIQIHKDGRAEIFGSGRHMATNKGPTAFSRALHSSDVTPLIIHD